MCMCSSQIRGPSNNCRSALADAKNVSLHQAAIGARDGTLTLMRDPGFASCPGMTSEGTSAFRSLLWEKGEPECFEVKQVDIRRFLREIGGAELVTIDIEGAEVQLLEALLDSPELGMVHSLFVETHEAQIPEIRALVRALRRRVKDVQAPYISLHWH